MITNQFNESELAGKKPQYIPLQVSAGILVHIGAGIYNSVAGAVKELVSNAYDADATRVTIMTNYPEFDRITVVDNGKGMTIDTFAKAMSSIGSSLKRELVPQGLTQDYHRPIIGHLGIGFMALSQVCDIAIVESQVSGSKIRFLAKLDFGSIRRKTREQILASTIEILQNRPKQLSQRERTSIPSEKTELEKLKTDLESVQDTIAKDVEIFSANADYESPEGEHLGYCIIYPELPAVPGGQGTRITLYPLDDAVTAAFIDQNRDMDAIPSGNLPEEYKSSAARTNKNKQRNLEEERKAWQQRRDSINSLDWRELCESLRKGTLAYEGLPQYHQFLWQLAMMSPVRYFDEGPVIIKPVLQTERKRLEAFKFSLIVDNRELFKPILLPSAKLALADPKSLREDLDFRVETFDHRVRVTKGEQQSELAFTGYLYWQSSQNRPSQIRGIEIYIRNVGIGLYDRSLLNFATVNTTSRAGQISGEIYVHAGLEEALNIDRNSFRETDSEYITLQRYIWEILGSTRRGDGVLGRSVDAYYGRKVTKDRDEDRKHLASLRDIIQKVVGGKIDVELSHTKGDAIFAEEGKNKLIVHLNSDGWPRGAAERRRVQTIMIALKTAAMAGYSPNDLVDLVEHLLIGDL